MSILQSCDISPTNIANESIERAETESKNWCSNVTLDEGLPAGDLPRLNYAYYEAISNASITIKEKLDMTDESKTYTAEQEAHKDELIDAAQLVINNHYEPLIMQEINSIVGNYMLCFDGNGITDTEAKIEHIPGTPDIRVRIEGTLTQKGTTLHFKRYECIEREYKIGAIRIFNMDKTIQRRLCMPGERVYGYIILDSPYKQSTSSIEVTRIN
ncbi:MAG: hypothetical protein E7082_01755 [Bacteroidales bacterium]|nr:hypothetical protein [Bacteroidales bacterium]